MKLVIASDHAGLSLKRELVEATSGRGEVTDLGPSDGTSVDYPDVASTVCARVQAEPGLLGVLVCGTGLGMAIAANKHRGIRAVVCRSEFEARMGRAHNDANVLCLGERVTGGGLARQILEAFLDARFEGGRHERRVQKLRDLEAGR